MRGSTEIWKGGPESAKESDGVHTRYHALEIQNLQYDLRKSSQWFIAAVQLPNEVARPGVNLEWG